MPKVDNHGVPAVLTQAEKTAAYPAKSFCISNLQANAQCVGFLMKHEKGVFKRLFGKSWKRKFCVLSGYHFYYFRDQTGSGREKSSGVINLRYYDRCALPLDVKYANLSNAFALSSSQKSEKHFILFQAESLEEQQKWMTDIQLVIFQCQTQGRSGNLARPRSHPSTPLISRDRDDTERPRSSSIPEAGYEGTFRSTSVSSAGGRAQTDQIDSGIESPPPPRPESRTGKPEVAYVPRILNYSQVVSELQSKLNARKSPEELNDSPRSSHHSLHKFPQIIDSYMPETNDEVSRSVSISSYDNNEEVGTRSFVQLSPPATPKLLRRGGNSKLDAQFEDALKLLEDSHEQSQDTREAGVVINREAPTVLPKPNREMYQSFLPANANAVGTTVDVSG